jgi:tRNA threonylcarbamoyladenosine biosynthesis protein TsaB
MILAIDTSTRWVGLALYDGAQVLGETVWQSHSNHTVEVAPAVSALMERSQIKPEDLKAIGVALGPGSFTSLRIGLGIAKGMALALRLPLVGVPTLDVLAAAQTLQDLPLVVILQAGRGRLAAGWYQVKSGRWQAQGEPQVLRVEELEQKIETPTLVVGELTPEERPILARKRKMILLATPAQSIRRPGYLAELAWKRWKNGKTDDPVSLSPIYLHLAEAIPA